MLLLYTSRIKAYNADEVLETVDKYKGDEVDTKKARACSNVDDNIPLLVQSSAAIIEPWAGQGRTFYSH